MSLRFPNFLGGRKNLGSAPLIGDVFALPVQLRPPEMGIVVNMEALWRHWEGGFVCGGRKWRTCLKLGGRFCLGRVEWLRDLIKLLVGFGEITLRRRSHPPETESPSGDGMTLRVGWKRLVIGDLARIGRAITARTAAIGRVILPVEGGDGAHA